VRWRRKREAASGRAGNDERAWSCGKRRAGVDVRETTNRCGRAGNSKRACGKRRAGVGMRGTVSGHAGNGEHTGNASGHVRAGNGERAAEMRAGMYRAAEM
jgi:hypothetical protein